MNLNNLFSFRGLHTRKEFWTIFVLQLLFQLVIIAFSHEPSRGLIILGMALIPVQLWVALANTAKRLRDAGYPVWITPIALIPVISISILVICGFFKSENHDYKQY